MSFITGLRCETCGTEYSDMDRINTCHACGGFLEAEYDYDRIRKSVRRELLRDRPRNTWRWHELLPVRDPANFVTLGEGGSPMLRMERLERAIGFGEFYAKNDTVNPTATFKDRSFAVAIAKARELGIQRASTYSSGNAGASFAAYAAKADMEALILVKSWATEEKLTMMATYGHKIVKLEFSTFADVKNMLDRAVRELGAYQFTVFVNPFRHEGNKTYAFEIAEEFGWEVPDWIIHPTSNGGGLYGSWKGWQELYRLGWIDRLPRMVAAQPSECSPIVQAFERGAPEAEPYGDPRATLAQSVGTDAPLGGGRRVLQALYESNGAAVAITEDEILHGIRLLGQEGIYSEPAGALSVVALEKLAAQGKIGPNDRVVCVVTGSGLKQPSAARMALPAEFETIPADFHALERVFGKLWGTPR